MNYLAHACLSFQHPDILEGNMISDFVKGKKQFDYSPGIHNGIVLHRAIDNFTDMHAATKELKEYFRADYRLYAAPLVDIVYDYFLANDSREFASSTELKEFTDLTYISLEKRLEVLPSAFQHIFPHMKEHDWLYNYRYKKGIERSFRGLVRRATYLSESGKAFSIFDKYSEQMRPVYESFFPEVKIFALQTLQELLKR